VSGVLKKLLDFESRFSDTVHLGFENPEYEKYLWIFPYGESCNNIKKSIIEAELVLNNKCSVFFPLKSKEEVVYGKFTGAIELFNEVITCDFFEVIKFSNLFFGFNIESKISKSCLRIARDIYKDKYNSTSIISFAKVWKMF
jgi:hypothetical protein